MKTKITFCFFGLFAFFSFVGKAQNEWKEINDFGSNPGNLKMFVFIPDSDFHNGKKLPLVVALHGCTQTAKTMSIESGWDELAKRYNFYVIYPQQKFLNNPSGCFNWFNKNDIEKDKGEVFSVKQMIDYAFKVYSIDTSKVFVYGLSAGAVMGVALLADYPSLFCGGAVLAGGPYLPENNAFDALSNMLSPDENPSKELGSTVRLQNPDYKGNYPALIIFHGDDDNVVNVKNSYQLVKQWASLVHTDTVPTKVERGFANNPDITRNIYYDSLHQEKILFYEVANLGHALMVFPGDSVYQGGQIGLFSINKHFFSTYWIGKDFGLIPGKQQ